jgi:hypothetical protein
MERYVKAYVFVQQRALEEENITHILSCKSAYEPFPDSLPIFFVICITLAVQRDKHIQKSVIFTMMCEVCVVVIREFGLGLLTGFSKGSR